MSGVWRVFKSSSIIARKCIKRILTNLTFDQLSSNVLWEGVGLCNDFLFTVYSWQSMDALRTTGTLPASGNV